MGCGRGPSTEAADRVWRLDKTAFAIHMPWGNRSQIRQRGSRKASHLAQTDTTSLPVVSVCV